MPSHLEQIAKVIQLSVAPVFLLTAVGTVLAVLSTRLARVVDRVRVVAARIEEGREGRRTRFDAELALLLRRRKLVNRAITSGVAAALLVCLVIVAAFVGFLAEVDLATVIASLFIGAMLAFVLALLLFLREVVLSLRSLEIESAAVRKADSRTPLREKGDAGEAR
jgi:hypothetical protein